jgi:hypothetical protein
MKKMESKEKFKQAFDVLINDFNAKLDEFRGNMQHFASDVKVQVEGQRENFQEYGEKLKGRINKIVDIDRVEKVRADVLAEAENVMDDAKNRIDNFFQYVNQQLNLGERKAKSTATNFTKQAATTKSKIEKEVKKAAVKVEKEVKTRVAKAEKNVKAATAKVAKKVEVAAKKTAAKAKAKAPAKPAKKTAAKKAAPKKAAKKPAAKKKAVKR